MSESRTVTLGHRFYDDHVERECLAGVELKRTKRDVTVELDEEAFDDLLSDAWYYGDASIAEGLEGQAFRQAALATFRKLAGAWPERAERYTKRYGQP